MPGKPSRAWQAFQRQVRLRGYENAVAWLLASTLPQELKDAALARAGRENIERERRRVTITQETLTSNRRRPGAWK